MGSQLGKYQLVAEIARGGMGIVYLAVAQGPARFSKLLVVKELKPDFVEDETFLEMFLEEARLAARLNHPNIVQTYEVGEENRRHFIVMDYLDGVSLAKVIRRKSPTMTLEMHIRILCEVLQALEYAHTLKDFDGSSLGIVHRDVNPANVFVTFDGQAKLVDFGIAKALDSNIETRTGVLKGKPAYMAPEQIGGNIDPRADVFSVGVMLWEAVSGQRMWSRKGDVEVLAGILKGEIPSIREAAPDTPEALIEIVDHALAPDPAKRYESARALQEALEDYVKPFPDATMRGVGKTITELFAEERAVRRAKVDAQLALLKSISGTGSSESLPSLLPTLDGRPISGANDQLASGSMPTGSTTGGASMSAAGMLPWHRSPNRRLAILGILALLLLVGGFALGLRVVSKNSTHDGASASATPTAGGSGSQANGAMAAPTPEVVETPPPPEVKPEPVASVSERPPEKPRPVAVTQRPVWTPPPRPVTPPKPPPAPTPEARTPDVDETKGKTGFLTLDTYPWCRVSLNGRVLGDTPLVHVALPVGTHVLTLENTSENLRKTTVVTISKPGETISKRLAF